MTCTIQKNHHYLDRRHWVVVELNLTASVEGMTIAYALVPLIPNELEPPADIGRNADIGAKARGTFAARLLSLRQSPRADAT